MAAALRGADRRQNSTVSFPAQFSSLTTCDSSFTPTWVLEKKESFSHGNTCAGLITRWGSIGLIRTHEQTPNSEIKSGIQCILIWWLSLQGQELAQSKSSMKGSGGDLRCLQNLDEFYSPEEQKSFTEADNHLFTVNFWLPWKQQNPLLN